MQITFDVKEFEPLIRAIVAETVRQIGSNGAMVSKARVSTDNQTPVLLPRMDSQIGDISGPEDEEYGYEFGCEGLVSSTFARSFLGVSNTKLWRIISDGQIRKRNDPTNNRAKICRRSIAEYVRGME